MLTPQEVSEHAFAKASFGGYNMAMVDEFLDVLTADYTTLYKENATLKAKMKVLVDKVEEYRSTEEAMRKALLTAQKMADELVAQAEAKKAELLKNAETEAKARIAELQQDIRSEQMRLTAAQNATAAYVGKLKELYQHEMDYLNGLGRLTAAAPKADPVSETAQAIGHAVEQSVREEEEKVTVAVPVEDKQDGGLYAELMELNMNPAEGERHKRPICQPIETPAPAPDESEEDDTAPTRRIDFSNLQFGKDYEIK